MHDKSSTVCGRHRAGSNARAYLAAGVAAAAVSVLAVNPVVSPSQAISEVNQEVRLAADSIANVPVNLAIDLINVPANEIQALNNWSDALQAGGSWWLKTPTNVWGWDPGNPPMLEALVAVLVPFPVISGNGGLPAGIDVNNPQQITSGNSILGGSAPPGTLGYILNVIVAAETPMHAGCGFTCNDVLGALSGYFQVPVSDILDGYTFPTITNPNDPSYPPAWSGATVPPIDPTAPFTNFLTSLTQDPANNPIKTVSLGDLQNVVQRLNDSGTVAFNPWFPGSYLITGFPTYDSGTLFQGLANGILARTCPACGSVVPSAVTNLPSEVIDGIGNALSPVTGVAQSTVTDFVTQHKYLAADTFLPNVSGATTQQVTNTPTATPKVVAPVATTLDVQQPQAPVTQVVKPDPTAVVNLPNTTTAPVLTNPATDGNKSTPSDAGKHRLPSSGGLADGVKSATNGISSAISKAVKSVSGGTGTSNTESKKAGEKG
jgi:hypothetical protein